jgi:hypothetical protein
MSNLSAHMGYEIVETYKGVQIKQQVFYLRKVGSPINERIWRNSFFRAYGRSFGTIAEARRHIDSLNLVPRPSAQESAEMIKHEIKGY